MNTMEDLRYLMFVTMLEGTTSLVAPGALGQKKREAR